MGNSKPSSKVSHTFRHAYIRPILIVYTLLSTIGTSYSCFTDGHALVQSNNCITLALNGSILLGVGLNSERSLRYTKNMIKFFMYFYILMFFILPVMASSYRASGSMAPEEPEHLIESVESLFKKHPESELTEFDRQLDVHTKNQIFNVFTDNSTKARVEELFHQKENRRVILMVPQNANFKQLAKYGHQIEGVSSKMVFNSIYQEIKGQEMFKSGMWSGYGMSLACILTIGLVYMQYELVERLWIHTVLVLPTRDDLNF